MLEKIGGQIQTPAMMLDAYEARLPSELQNNTYLSRVYHYLRENIPNYSVLNYMVVHGDVNHRNWLVSNNYLYLVDWDSVMVADPALDLGMLLGHYVPRSSWNKWLLSYGMRPSDEALTRIKWYALYNFLQEIVRHYQTGEKREMNAEILRLKQAFGY